MGALFQNVGEWVVNNPLETAAIFAGIYGFWGLAYLWEKRTREKLEGISRKK